MAGSLSGISGQQQYAVSQALQQSGSQNTTQQQVRENDNAQTQQATAPTQGAHVQNIKPQDSSVQNERVAQAAAGELSESADTERGSVIDITV